LGLYQLAGDGQIQSTTRPTGVEARPAAALEAVKDVGQVLSRMPSMDSI
jgi:hypothetical protein